MRDEVRHVEQVADDVAAAEEHDHCRCAERNSGSRRKPREHLHEKERCACSCPQRHREVGREQPRPLADESRGQIVPERCSQQSVPTAVHSVTDGPSADHQIVQYRIPPMPIRIGEDDMSGAAAHGPSAPHGDCDCELQPRDLPLRRDLSLSPARGAPDQIPERVREARQQRNRRPDFEPSGQKNGQWQRQVRNGRSIQRIHGAL